MAEIFSICMQEEASVHESPYYYSRIPTRYVQLREGHGIEGDLKAGHHPKRHLNIMSHGTLQALANEGFRTNPGEMGEQIIIKGLDVNTLVAGTQIRIGDEAIITVNEPRTGCDWFEQIQGKSPDQVKGRMGMMASVTASGRIRVGDRVRVVKAVPA